MTELDSQHTVETLLKPVRVADHEPDVNHLSELDF